MNLIEAICVSALLLGLAFVAGLLSRHWGTAGLLVGLVPVATLAALLIFGVIRNSVAQIRLSRTNWPTCQKGTCSARDYILVEWNPAKTVLRCKCGDLYVSENGYFRPARDVQEP